MADTNAVNVPSTADPNTQELVFAILRALLQLLGGLGIGIGANINDGTLMVVASVVATVGGTLWSLWSKFQAAKKAHSGAVASALTGTAVQAK